MHKAKDISKDILLFGGKKGGNVTRLNASSTNAPAKPFYTIAEAAELLLKNPKTIHRYCLDGTLSGIPERHNRGITFRIPKASLEDYLRRAEQRAEQETKQRPISASTTLGNLFTPPMIAKYRLACLRGLIGKRPYVESTVDKYIRNIRVYLREVGGVINASGYEDFCLTTEEKEHAKREDMHRALVSYSKFLLREGLSDPEELAALQQVKPTRNGEPKRRFISRNEFETILKACRNIRDTFLVYCLAETGLRASEFANLAVKDVSLEGGYLFIAESKWGKSRKVGITQTLETILRQYLEEEQPTRWLFPNKEGKKLTRHGVRLRLNRIGDDAGIHLHPHMLRRAFVTFKANEGKQLVFIQRACGHSSITTTQRSYLMTTEEETIAAMRGW